MATLTRLDPTHVDLTNFDLHGIVRSARHGSDRLAAEVTHRAVDLAKDAAYVSVGLGLLNYQRARVRGRELSRSMRR